jgi:hypothetical protein
VLASCGACTTGRDGLSINEDGGDVRLHSNCLFPSRGLSPRLGACRGASWLPPLGLIVGQMAPHPGRIHLQLTRSLKLQHGRVAKLSLETKTETLPLTCAQAQLTAALRGNVPRLKPPTAYRACLSGPPGAGALQGVWPAMSSLPEQRRTSFSLDREGSGADALADSSAAAVEADAAAQQSVTASRVGELGGRQQAAAAAPGVCPPGCVLCSRRC